MHPAQSRPPPAAAAQPCTLERRCRAVQAPFCGPQQPAAGQAGGTGLGRREILQLCSVLTASAALGLAGAPAAQAADVNPELNSRLKKYIKKKRLDPLATYVPTLLLAREQLEATGQLMVRDPLKVREALRSGVFKSMRDDVRAVVEYAVGDTDLPGNSPAPQLNVPEGATPTEVGALGAAFFRSLEAYDRALGDGLRGGELDLGRARGALAQALADLDRVLALLPPPLVEQGRRVVEAGRSSGGDGGGGSGGSAEVERLQRLIPAVAE